MSTNETDSAVFVKSVAVLASVFVLVGAGMEAVSRLWGVSSPVSPRDRSLVSRLGRQRSERPVFVVGAVAITVVLLLFPFVDAVLRVADVAAPFEYWDFGAYTQALDRWQGGEPLYVTNENGGYDGGYLYPPFFLLVVWPFAQFGFGTGAWLWQLSSVVFLWAGLQLVVRELGHDLRLWERGLLLWALVGFHPLLFSVKQGQISAFLAGLLTLSLYGLLVGRRTHGGVPGYASGAFTGVVGSVKLVYAPIGAHLLVDRRRLLGAVVCGFGLLVTSVAVFGVETNVSYLDVLLWGKNTPVRSPLLWLAPYFRPLYAFQFVALPVRVLGSLVVAGLAIAGASSDADRETFVLGVAAMPLLAPRAYTYYLTALLPAVMVMLAVELDVDGRPLLPVLACFLLHSHSYGLRLAVHLVPRFVPQDVVPVLDVPFDALVVSLVQPGVWGALLLAALAGVRVATVASIVWPSDA